MTRAFTLLELAIVVSITGVLVPTIFWSWRSIDDQQRVSVARVSAASAVRGVADELRRDARTRQWAGAPATGPAVTLEGGAPCSSIAYRVERTVLVRDACGDARALARHVRAIERSDETVTLTFALPGAVRDTAFVIGVHARPRSAP